MYSLPLIVASGDAGYAENMPMHVNVHKTANATPQFASDQPKMGKPNTQ